MVNFDDLLSEINDFGKYQKIRYFLICLAGMLPPIVTYVHSFTAANPTHKCALTDSFANYTNVTLNKCEIITNNETIQCNEWTFDKTYYQSTLTEEWSMVCSKSVWRGTLQTIYFSGYLVGSIVLGVMADLFGRRPIMLSSFVLILLGGFGSAFGPQKAIGNVGSYVVYSICRFLIACGTRGINVTGFVLAMEIVGKSKRTFAGIIFEVFFALGQLILVAFAYLFRDWRTLAWVSILPCVPFISYYFFIPESARWLLTKERTDDAYKILAHVAKANKRELNPETWKSFLASEAEKPPVKNESLVTLFKSPILLIITSLLFLNWIVNNFIFYGVGLKSNDLGLNPYLTFAISAAVELVAYIVTYFLVDKAGRKYPYFAFLLLAGASLLSIAFIDHVMTTVVLAMVGKFCISSAYAIIYMYSTELFPTSIRNSCMGACSMMARIGSMTAPQILILGDITSKALPFLIFGISGLATALSTLLFPETLHRDMPNNIAEAEELNALRCMRKPKPKYETETEGEAAEKFELNS